MTALEVYNLSSYLTLLGSLIIAFSCLYKYKERENHVRILGIYGVVSICFSLGQYFIVLFIKGFPFNSIANSFVILEVWFFSLLYVYATKSNSFKKGILIAGSVYSIFYLTIWLFFPERAFSLIRFCRDILIIFYAVAYFFFLIRKLPQENLLKLPMFWINSVAIFYFSGTLILSIMADYLIIVLEDDMTGFWAFRNFFRFGFCLVLAYAGWLDYKATKTTVVGS